MQQLLPITTEAILLVLPIHAFIYMPLLLFYMKHNGVLGFWGSPPHRCAASVYRGVGGGPC